MRRGIRRGFGAAVLLAGVAFLGACGGADAAAEASAAETNGATPATASAGVVYVDVRTPAEFASGHVQGAINIPHTEMPSRWQELAEYRDRPMVVYCRTGRRSGIALQVLSRQGFDNAQNGGGLDDLARLGVAVTR